MYTTINLSDVSVPYTTKSSWRKEAMIDKKASIGLRIVFGVIILVLIVVGIFFFYNYQIKKEYYIPIEPNETLPLTASTPLAIPSVIDLKEDIQIIKTGFYNTANNKTINSKLGITKCISANMMEDGNITADPLPKDIPIVNSPCKEVMPSESSMFEISIEKPKTLQPGIYICRMVVFNAGKDCDFDPRDHSKLSYPMNESYRPELPGSVYDTKLFRLDIE